MEGNVVYPPNAKHVDVEQSSAEITKNLKALSEQLQDMDIAKDNTKYMPLAEHLVQSKLVRHASKDVRLLNACCLADLLRICVPHNPVSRDGSLKELFSFFIRVLRGLEDVEGSNYHRYFYILESLATCKSFLLLGKLRSEETAITLTGKLFNLFFHVVSDAHVGKAQSLMLDIMSGLVNETNCMDNDLLELIYQHILPPFKHQMPAAYLLASDLLRLTANTIEPHVLNFFNDVMSPLNGADDDDFTPSKTPKSSSKSGNGAGVNGGGSRKKNSLTVQRIYELMYEVYATAPATLSPVLPLVEMKLKSLETDDRVLAVECLGKMFGHENSQLYLDNNNLWSAFLSRGRDASAEVRLKFLKAVPKILEKHFDDVGSDVCAMLTKLSRDTSTDIRKETIKTIEVVGFVNFSWVNLELLAAVKDRTRDTNWSVRKAAMTAGANWYQHCFSSSEKSLSPTSLWSQSGPRVKLSWVAPKLLANYYSAGNDEKVFVEDLLFSKVFADPSEETTVSCLKFLEVFCEIDEQSCQIFQALLKNGALKKRGFDSELGKELISKICAFLARPEQSVLNNNYYSWEEIPQNKFKENDLRSVFDTQDSLVAISSSDDKKLRALGMCEFLFLCYPDLFCSSHCVCQFSNLLKFVIQRKVSVSYDVIKLIMRCVILLTNSVQEKMKNPDATNDNDKKDLDGFEAVKNNLLESVNSILAHSNDPKLCKYSVVLSWAIVTESEERSSMLAKLFKQLTSKMSLASYNLLGILGAATQLAFVGAQELHGDLQKFISDFVTKQLISFDICDLKEDDQDRFITAKVYGLKMITRWLIGLNGANLRLVESTLKMLSTGIINGGSFAERSDNNETSANDAEKECSMIRLTAAKMILKLNAVKTYANIMTEEQFHVVSSVMLDPCQEVRSAFAAKLDRHCSSQRLQLKFLAPFAFCGREPSSDLKEKFRVYLRKNLIKRKHLVKNSKLFKSSDSTAADPKQKRQAIFSNVDNVMLHVVHLLAHFHEFDSLKNVEVLKALKDCLWFVMNILMYELDEFSYTYHKFMLDNLKMCKDATVDDIDQESNEKLYAICDLALTMLNARVKTFDSIAVTELSLAIPARLYKTDESVKDMNRKLYIPNALTEKPKMTLDVSQAEKAKKKPQKSKQLQKDDQTSNPDTVSEESEVKGSKSKQTKISDHVMTSFVAPRSQRQAKKRYNLSSTEESGGASSSENDPGSPDFKANISRKRKTKTDDAENNESPSAKKVYSTRTRNRKAESNNANVLVEKVVNYADDKTSESDASPAKSEVYNSTPARKPKASPVSSRTPAKIPRNAQPWDAKIAQRSAEIVAKGKERQGSAKSPTPQNKMTQSLKSDKQNLLKQEKKNSLSPDKRQSTISDLFGSSKTGRAKSGQAEESKNLPTKSQEDKKPNRSRKAAPYKDAIVEVEPNTKEDSSNKRTEKNRIKKTPEAEAPTPKRRTRATVLESDDNESETTSQSNSQKKSETPASRKTPRNRKTPVKTGSVSQGSSTVVSPGSSLDEGTPSNRTRNRIRSVVQ